MSSENSLSRRRFIQSATAGATIAGLSAASTSRLSGQTRSTPRGKVRWRFQAQRLEETFSDGSTVPFFRYVAVGNTRSNGRLPLMQDRESRTLSVSIENLVDFPIQPTILNHGVGPVIMPQETGIWQFTMPPAGTWIFTENLLGIFASSAGFAAPLISNPAKPTSKPLRSYYLMFQDTDDRWNNAIDNGNVPDETVFEPNFHTLNGLTFPETMNDRSTRIDCFVGEDVLLRIGNCSNIRHSLHFHGYHANLVKQNNKLETRFPEKDSFPIPANSTSEIVLPVVQEGEYPLHPHNITTITDNGLYQAGSATCIDAQFK